MRLAAEHVRAAVQRRTPKVLVSRNRIASTAAASAGRQSTVSVTPGRFFFIWMAVVKTSSTPELPQPRGAVADQFAAQVVEVGFQHANLIGVAAAALDGFAHQQPQNVGSLGEIFLARPVADAFDLHGRQRAERIGQRGQNGRPGGRGHFACDRRLGQRDAAQQFGRGGGGNAALAVGDADLAPPVGTGEATSRSAPSRSQPTAAPTMSAIESAAPTSWKWTFSIVVPCTLASASARRRENPPGKLLLPLG